MEALMFSVHYRNEIRIEKGETTPTVSAAYGMGGGIIPYVCLEENRQVFSVEGNGLRPSHLGVGISDADAPMYTLNTTEVHGVMYEDFL